jgi:hypothetical protein
MVIVGLPNAQVIQQMTISKFHYTIPYAGCQLEKQKDTMNYNYLTNEELIKENNLIWSRVLP